MINLRPRGAVSIPSAPIAAPARCPLCEQPGAKRRFDTRDRIHGIPGDFAIHRCASCGAWFVQPQLSAGELLRYYPPDYGRYRHGKALAASADSSWRRFVLEHRYGYPPRRGQCSTLAHKIAAWMLSQVMAKGVLPFRGGGKILDVGCGGGSYLQRLKRSGWDGYGVEPSMDGARQAQSLGLNVKHGTLEEAQFPANFFDVIRLSHVLEHLPDPNAAMREIRRILKDDGLVYVSVPNTRSVTFRLFREHWYALDAPRHLISYSPGALRFLAHRAEFEIVRMNFAAGPFNFVRSMKYLAEARGERFPAWLGRIRWEHSKLVRRLLKPLFFVIDGLGYGDLLHATLRKRRPDRRRV